MVKAKPIADPTCPVTALDSSACRRSWFTFDSPRTMHLTVLEKHHASNRRHTRDTQTTKRSLQPEFKLKNAIIMEKPTCGPKHGSGQRALLAFLMSVPVFTQRHEHVCSM